MDLSKDQGLGQDSKLFRGLYQALFVLLDLGHSKLVVVGSHNYRPIKFPTLQWDVKGSAGRGGVDKHPSPPNTPILEKTG